ncbi:MAG: hypothetical protein M1814_002421 [Vezdaea aestivalis]|nr:MAG: hypothetical protein M1814_002421 [Vezdaea aestivalis]
MSSPKILILGGTGATGILTVEGAINAGYDVTVLVRSPEKLGSTLSSSPKLRIIKGSFSDTNTLADAFAGQDVVLSLLGPSNPLGFNGQVFPSIYRSVLGAMRENSVPRIYALGTFSIPDEHDKQSFLKTLMVWFIWLVAHKGWMEFTGIGELFKNEGEGIDWTVFRVGWLLNGDKGREAVAGYLGDGQTNLHVRRSEIAKWLLGEVSRGGKEWIGMAPGISSGGKREKSA